MIVSFVFRESTWQSDLLETEKMLRALEEQHDLKPKNGRIAPTASYFRSLAQRLREGGFAGCTPTAAWHVWKAVFRTIDKLRKRHALNAEIAFWYGVDPYQLTPEAHAAMLVNLPRMKAQEILHRGDYDPTDYGFAYDLVLLATGDEKKALKARGDALERFVDSKTAR